MEDTGDILVESATRDMRHAVHIAVLYHLQHLLHIDSRRRQQHLAQRLLRIQFRINSMQILARVCHNLTHEAEAVGVYARRSNTHQHIAHCHLRAVNQFRLFHHARRVARNVVLAVAVHPGHLRGLAAHERAARLPTTFCHTGYYRLYLRRHIMSDSHII